MKKILFIAFACVLTVTIKAQKVGGPAMQKLNMDEFAISILYVDSEDENK